MIDLERPTSLGDVAIEKRCIASVLLVSKDRVAGGGVVKSSAHAAGALGLTVHAETGCAVIINSRDAGVFASRYSMHSVNSSRRYRPINSIAGAGISIRSVGAASSGDAGAARAASPIPVHSDAGGTYG